MVFGGKVLKFNDKTMAGAALFGFAKCTLFDTDDYIS
jgi:hypothetical protein